MTVYNSTIQPNVNNSSVVLAAQPTVEGKRNFITSVEIAEEAGRNHKDVMRSIREMEPAWEQVNGRKFALVDYIDKKGESRPCYQFAYEEFMYVISKFDDITRARLVTRWAKLETGQAKPMYQQVEQPNQERLTFKDKLYYVKEVQKMLKLNDASTLGLLQKVAAPLNLPVPDYVDSRGILMSATAALMEFGNVCDIRHFNEAMVNRGFLEELSRKSSKGLTKKFKHLTATGLKWGENQVNPKSPQQTQPLYYKNKFEELLKELKLK